MESRAFEGKKPCPLCAKLADVIAYKNLEDNTVLWRYHQCVPCEYIGELSATYNGAEDKDFVPTERSALPASPHFNKERRTGSLLSPRLKRRGFPP